MRTSTILFGLLFTPLLGLIGCGSSDGMANAPVEISFPDGTVRKARFSPDGKTIAYMIDENSTRSGFSVAVMTKAGEDRKTLAPAGSDLAGPVWALDGKRIYFNSDLGVSLVAASGGTPSLVVDDFATEDLDLSADGKRLVYATRGGNLVLVDLDDPTMPRNLGTPGTSPRFSPDGKTIAFASAKMIQFLDLASYKLSADAISTGTNLASVDWFPDGKRVAITAAGGIEIVTLGSSPKHVLMREEFETKDVDVSPDGESIAYGIDRLSIIVVLPVL